MRLIGIYLEMIEPLVSEEEVIVFSGLIDNGSKIKKTKEYAGVGVKIAGMTGGMTRVINFVRCERKDGAMLCEVLLNCYETFNQSVSELKKLMGHVSGEAESFTPA